MYPFYDSKSEEKTLASYIEKQHHERSQAGHFTNRRAEKRS
jgi:hypothetical protein